MEKLGLDRVVFMTAGIPPHKALAFNTSPEDRINMLKLATQANDKFFIDDFEAGFEEKAYSYISLERIHKSLHKSSVIYFIIGADSLMQLDKWKMPEKLLSLCTFAVVPREGYTKAQCEEKIDTLTKEYGGKILYLDCEKYDMSSRITSYNVCYTKLLRYFFCGGIARRTSLAAPAPTQGVRSLLSIRRRG